MRRRKRMIATLVLAALLCGIFQVRGSVSENAFVKQAAAETEVIDVGLGWSIDKETGKLTIQSDEGMADWARSSGSRIAYYLDGDFKFIKILEIQDGVTYIPDKEDSDKDGAFSGTYHSALTDVILPKSITKIGSGAFQRCKNLERVTLSGGLLEIGGFAFCECEKLEEIILPAGVKTIGNYAFCETAIKELTIPASVESIGYMAFGSDLGDVQPTALSKVTMLGTRPITFGDKIFGYANYEAYGEGYAYFDGTIHVPKGFKNSVYGDLSSYYRTKVVDDIDVHVHDDSGDAYYETLEGDTATLDAGMYYLKEDVVMGAELEITGDVSLCLAGHTLTGTINVENGGVLKLFDCETTGTLTNGNEGSGVIRVRDGGKAEIHGGNLEAEKGSAVSVESGGELSVKGGTISGKPYGLELAGKAFLAGMPEIQGETAAVCMKASGLLTANDKNGSYYAGDQLTVDAGDANIRKDTVIIEGTNENNRSNFIPVSGSTYVFLPDGETIKKHIHDWDNSVTVAEWKTSEEKHWYACDCGEIKEEGEHVYDDAGDILCNVCGYSRSALDQQPPTGKIAIGETEWPDFSGTIVFETFYRETKTAVITAEDGASDVVSGVDKIYYYISDRALTLDEVQALEGSEWTEGASVSINPDRKCVIYAKIADRAGNVLYLSSEGLTFDKTAPKIEGVADGGTYRTPQTVTVTDENLTAVKVNGEEVTLENGKFTLEAKSGAQTIVAADKAGNETTVTVTVKTAAENLEDLKKIVEDILKEIPVTNETTAEDIREAAEDALEEAGITDITVNVDDFTKEEATEGEEGSITGTVTITSGSEPDKVTENVEIDRTILAKPDTTPPTGTITIEMNAWKSFLNKITFGKFFKEAKTVEITAEDNVSGVDKIYYHISDRALSLDEVRALEGSDWTEGASVSINPDRKCVIYAKLTDKAGNISYLSSDGLTFDGTAPKIEGVKDGGTYRAPQTVTVTDGDLAAVKVDGEEVTLENGKFTLGAKSGAQTIVAADKAGNETTVTATVKTAAENLEDAKKIVEDILKEIPVTNETTAEDIREAAEDALEEAGITDITVNVDDFTKEEAAEEAEGGIVGRITIMSGSGPNEAAGEVPFGRTIAKLEKDSQSDGENDANNDENSRNEGETNAVSHGNNDPAAEANSAEQAQQPETGDAGHVEIYVTMAMLAGLIALLLCLLERRRKMREE